MDLESKMEEYMHPLFGEMASTTIERQKSKLGIEGKKLTREEYIELIGAIRKLCKSMAGEAIATRIYEGLIDIVNQEI